LKALTLTSTVYGCLLVVSVYHFCAIYLSSLD
jgi:hypothetical protein